MLTPKVLHSVVEAPPVAAAPTEEEVSAPAPTGSQDGPRYPLRNKRRQMGTLRTFHP